MGKLDGRPVIDERFGTGASLRSRQLEAGQFSKAIGAEHLGIGLRQIYPSGAEGDNLAPARPRPAGGAGPGLLAGRAGPVEGADPGLTPPPLGKNGEIVEAGAAPDSSRQYLVCVAERDLSALIRRNWRGHWCSRRRGVRGGVSLARARSGQKAYIGQAMGSFSMAAPSCRRPSTSAKVRVGVPAKVRAATGD
jgi:hypothetical protein